MQNYVSGPETLIPSTGIRILLLQNFDTFFSSILTSLFSSGLHADSMTIMNMKL
jgi:hypothetical protein